MNITALDHLVLTVKDLQATIDFYTTILGMTAISFGDDRKALQFGQQKINLHELGKEIKPNATHAGVGTADLCLLTDTPLDEVMAHLQAHHVPIIDGIVPRTGAVGKISSIYIHDPNGNLIEISRYDAPNPRPFSNTAKIKEVIYGLVTFLATSIGLWLHREHTSADQAFWLMTGTVAGLWLACFFADVLAQNITISNRTERQHAHHHAFDSSLGILIAGRMPVVFLLCAYLDWVGLDGAILASIGAILLQLLLFAVLSLYRKQNALWANVLTISLQSVLFVVILLLKLGH